MKKFSLVALLMVAAAIPAIPHFIGNAVEEGFRVGHEEMATEASLSGFIVELVDYRR